MRNTADATGGKPIAVLSQSISGVSAINPLVAFYDIHGGRIVVLFFYFVPDTTRDRLYIKNNIIKELDGPTVSALRRTYAKTKQHILVIGWVTNIYYFELLRASEGTLSRWSRLYSQSSAPTKPHWACVVGYGRFSLCVINKEGLCLSSGDIG
jgi:hypothetical protein